MSSSSPSSGQQDAGLIVEWIEPARVQAQHMADEPRFAGDVVAWHEKQVRAYAQQSIPRATRARIRKCAHHYSGGNEPEHITVSFKQGSKELGAYHVHTDRTS
ncbi:uncharacterized protein PHACADRAFT_197234 [Phanerochaete carnosa HHB-10118-sp]|uniref:Uncharacterized protein n=1 Tax=Phanerochaete carnosa (strain HHB-10118-sp) TaxID=650164 RepID=K5W786_PHACS|nr:uncharacterized protein PHACADRAFT_197234 [Phanerochaete carnosa HHB-10118-sp]EKM54804.1 hypothetical protein PHACADRAFT_197234 [Phanerochaete carnosa HHB-10118-sp]